MKSVMLSIRPKWCAKICNEIGKEDGKPVYEKQWELRKDKPTKVKVPFKCYIYCTMGKLPKDILYFAHNVNGDHICDYVANGKVIGYFTCDKFIQVPCRVTQPYWFKKGTCLSNEEFMDYLGNKDGFAWHISDLKIYDKPKYLSEFKGSNGNPIERAFQSWGYCEEIE